MKKLFSVILTVLMAASMTACDSDTKNVSSAPSTVILNIETGDNAKPIEVDVSNMDNPYVYKTLIIDLPKDFVSTEEINEEAGIVMAYKGDPTTSTDCFTFSDTGLKQSIEDFNKEEMTEDFRKKFEGFISFEKFSQTKCNGFDALDIRFERSIGDAKILQMQYYVFAKNTTYIITYTTEVKKNVNDYDKSISSLIIK